APVGPGRPRDPCSPWGPGIAKLTAIAATAKATARTANIVLTRPPPMAADLTEPPADLLPCMLRHGDNLRKYVPPARRNLHPAAVAWRGRGAGTIGADTSTGGESGGASPVPRPREGRSGRRRTVVVLMAALVVLSAVSL